MFEPYIVFRRQEYPETHWSVFTEPWYEELSEERGEPARRTASGAVGPAGASRRKSQFFTSPAFRPIGHGEGVRELTRGGRPPKTNPVVLGVHVNLQGEPSDTNMEGENLLFHPVSEKKEEEGIRTLPCESVAVFN